MFKKLSLQFKELPIFNHPLYLRYSNVIVPGTVVIVGLLVALLVTVPQVLKLFETFKTINELNQKKTFLEEKISNLSNINMELYRRNLDTALVALPVDEDVPGVMGEVLVALSGSGMVLDSITFIGSGATEASSTVGEYTLRLDISGNEENLNTFLQRIKEIPRIVKMVNIEVTQTRQGRLTAGIGLVTIYQKLPDHIGTVDEPVPVITDADREVLAGIDEKIRALPQSAAPSEGSVPVPGKTNPFSP